MLVSFPFANIYILLACASDITSKVFFSLSCVLVKSESFVSSIANNPFKAYFLAYEEVEPVS